MKLPWGFPVRKITNCPAELSQQQPQQISWDKEKGEDHDCYSIAWTENCKVP